jgi:DNA-binding LacI/PurR family transcriptional regulator
MSETTSLKKPVPHKRHQVAEGLRTLIATLSSGDRLPSVSELERHFGVATGTVEAAIKMLRREGLVASQPGAGLYVAERVRSAGSVDAVDASGGVARKTRYATLAVLAHSSNPFFRCCVEELTLQAAAAGLKVVCHYGSPDDSLKDYLGDALDLETLRPAGFLVFSYKLVSIASALVERGHRTVLVGSLPADVVPSVPCVCGDQEHGAYLATRRLLDLGHRRIACNERILSSGRRRGHERALREARITGPARTFHVPPHSWDDPPLLRRHLEREDAPTGILTWSDNEAVPLLHLLHRAGLRVPEDVSVMGYDNLPDGAHSRPPLDTIDGHIAVQIRQALSILASQPKEGPFPLVSVTPTLVCRASCARPRV